MKKSLPGLTIVNIVATSELEQRVDLDKLACTKGFLYDYAIYPCAYLKDENMQATVSIFASGKMICVGSKSLDSARHDLKHAAKRLAELGLIEPTEIDAKLRNIVATGELGCTIDLGKLSRKLSHVIYEPEQFPGMIYYANELEGASILIFANGRVVFAGLKSFKSLKVGKRVLASLSGLISKA